MKNNELENGNGKQEKAVPNDPEFEMLLRRAYNTDSDAEKEATLKMMEKDTINRETLEGILIIKRNKGFNSIEEHLRWVEEDKKNFRDFFEDYKTRKKVKRVVK